MSDTYNGGVSLVSSNVNLRHVVPQFHNSFSDRIDRILQDFFVKGFGASSLGLRSVG